MIKQYLYPGQTLSWLIGVLGIGISMSQLDPLVRYLIAGLSILILVFTVLIKAEEFLKKRHKRLMREESRGFRAFLSFLSDKTDDFDRLDQKDVENIENAHDKFQEHQ